MISEAIARPVATLFGLGVLCAAGIAFVQIGVYGLLSRASAALYCVAVYHCEMRKAHRSALREIKAEYRRETRFYRTEYERNYLDLGGKSNA